MVRGVPEFHTASFNWRVRRLVDSGFIARDCVRAVSPKPIYSITYVGKVTLADLCPVMDKGRHKDAASHVNLIHCLHLNRLHLSLMEQEVPKVWQSEINVRATNEFTTVPFVKNYDAIVSVVLYGHTVSFALEYERSPKKPKTYLRIRDLLEQERQIHRFLYLVPEDNLSSLLCDCFAGTTARIYVGLAKDWFDSFMAMHVIEASSGRERHITAL
jgi:hypothetical protein